MATTADSAVFVDTNILVYANFPQSPFHDPALNRLTELEANRAPLWTSRQVLREFLATVTRPGIVTPTPTAAALSRKIGEFERSFKIADEDAATTKLLVEILESRTIRGKQIHDANIVATMRRYGIQRLLTHNVEDFKRFEAYIHILPLVS